eukprot:TRINITY_DN29754_c0_g1_i1.p1 TRINITY_DN29754_c0_g1~~TRINITY_DN29754_c0_g1_i1.p1  ORF type:complete len:666 (+),score=140.52 TRINITY_DN29754_c0_g1_i1:28-2025(+)
MRRLASWVLVLLCTASGLSSAPRQAARAYNNLAADLHKHGRIDQAQQALESAIAADPLYAQARMNLANLYRVKASFREAAGHFQIASEHVPSDPQAHLGLSYALNSLGEVGAAMQAVRDALTVRPGLFEAEVHLGVMHAGLREYHEARRSFMHALQERPSSPELLIDMATVEASLGMEAQSQERLLAALSLDPTSSRAYSMLGRGHVATKRYYDAHPYLVEAVSLNPGNVPAYNNLGVVFEKTGHLDEALSLYTTATLLSPGLVETYNNIANIYTLKQQPQNAIKNYMVALTLQPDRGMTAYNLGTIHAENGDFSKQEHYMVRSQRIFLHKWNATAPASTLSNCQGQSRRLVRHWHGERSVRISAADPSISIPAHTFGFPKPHNGTLDNLGPNPAHDHLVFHEPRSFVAVLKGPGLVVEGRDAVIHDRCRLFLPIHDRYIPLHDQLLLPPGVEVSFSVREDVVLEEAGTVLQMASNNYFHFMAEVLPRLLLLEPSLPPSTPILLPDKPFVSQFMEALGLAGRVVIPYNVSTRYRVSTLYTADWRPTSERPGAQFFAPQWLLQRLRSRLLAPSQSAPSLPTVVLISRNDTEHRRVTNEWSLKRALQARLGPAVQVKLHVGANSTVDNTRASFRNALAVVGAHGAGLANIIFCPHKALVLELSLIHI